MAYDKIWMTLRFEDSFGRTKNKKVELASVDATQAAIDAAAIAAAYEAACLGIIRSYVVSGQMAVETAASAGSNVDTGVTVKAQLSSRPEKASLKWPMPDPSYLLAGGVVDTSDSLVTDIEDLYVPTTGVALLSDGETIVGFISGLLDK